MSSGTGDLKLWYRQPPDEWVQALPLGNGRLAPWCSAALPASASS